MKWKEEAVEKGSSFIYFNREDDLISSLHFSFPVKCPCLSRVSLPRQENFSSFLFASSNRLVNRFTKVYAVCPSICLEEEAGGKKKKKKKKNATR